MAQPFAGTMASCLFPMITRGQGFLGQPTFGPPLAGPPPPQGGGSLRKALAQAYLRRDGDGSDASLAALGVRLFWWFFLGSDCFI